MTLDDLIATAGKQWRPARLCVRDSNGHIQPVCRVSFHENSSGGIAILLEESELRDHCVTKPEEPDAT